MARMTDVAVVTFDGFNELDAFGAYTILNRCRAAGLSAWITTPTPTVTSMNGVEVSGQRPLEFAAQAQVVLVGSGVKTRQIVEDDALLRSLPLAPERQLIGSQCSGALILAKLGLLAGTSACTDVVTRPYLEACDVKVLDAPFHADGDVATAGGCLASRYLAAWTILRTLGEDAVREAFHYVAPVGEENETIAHVLAVVDGRKFADAA
jgi:transcriptional regulator GlxA family with amidase domain